MGYEQIIMPKKNADKLDGKVRQGQCRIIGAKTSMTPSMPLKENKKRGFSMKPRFHNIGNIELTNAMMTAAGRILIF